MKFKSPLVSILTTIYNGDQFIDDAISSVLNQTYTNWEHIIIENGSTDASVNELMKFKDSRIKILRLQNNIGRTNALILAAKEAKGEYICILDIDDTYEMTKIEEQVHYLNENKNVSLLATSYNLIDKTRKLIDTILIYNNQYVFPNTFSYLNPIAHSSVMYKRINYEEVNGYDNSLIFAQDFDLWIKLSQIGSIKFIEKSLTNIRLTVTSMSNDKSQERLRYNEVTKLFLKSKLISESHLTREDLKNYKIELLNRELNILLNINPKSYIHISLIVIKKFLIKITK